MSVLTAPLLIALGLAFVGGLLSFLSPCVLPLAPAFLGHLAGATLRGDTPPARSVLLGHALAFVIGFATIFTVAGIAAGAFIGALQEGLDVIRVIGGLAVIVMGLHVAGVITIPLLYREVKLDGGAVKPGSLLSSFLVGIFFAAGWSPCVGALLTGIFALAATQPAQAGLLFFSYSLGLGVPFVVAALLLERAHGVLRRVNRHRRALSRVSGLFLALVGVLLLTNTFAFLAALLPPIELPGLQ